MNTSLKEKTETLSHDARMALLHKALLQAAELTEKNIIPLDESKTEYTKRKEEEERRSLLKAGLLLAGSISILAVLGFRAKKYAEDKAREELEKLDEQRKEMARRLSQIKGRI